MVGAERLGKVFNARLGKCFDMSRSVNLGEVALC